MSYGNNNQYGTNTYNNTGNHNINTFSSYRERKHESMVKHQQQQQLKDYSNNSNNNPTTANTNRLIS